MNLTTYILEGQIRRTVTLEGQVSRQTLCYNLSGQMYVGTLDGMADRMPLQKINGILEGEANLFPFIGYLLPLNADLNPDGTMTCLIGLVMPILAGIAPDSNVQASIQYTGSLTTLLEAEATVLASVNITALLESSLDPDSSLDSDMVGIFGATLSLDPEASLSASLNLTLGLMAEIAPTATMDSVMDVIHGTFAEFDPDGDLAGELDITFGFASDLTPEADTNQDILLGAVVQTALNPEADTNQDMRRILGVESDLNPEANLSGEIGQQFLVSASLTPEADMDVWAQVLLFDEDVLHAIAAVEKDIRYWTWSTNGGWSYHGIVDTFANTPYTYPIHNTGIGFKGSALAFACWVNQTIYYFVQTGPNPLDFTRSAIATSPSQAIAFCQGENFEHFTGQRTSGNDRFLEYHKRDGATITTETIATTNVVTGDYAILGTSTKIYEDSDGYVHVLTLNRWRTNPLVYDAWHYTNRSSSWVGTKYHPTGESKTPVFLFKDDVIYAALLDGTGSPAQSKFYTYDIATDTWDVENIGVLTSITYPDTYALFEHDGIFDLVWDNDSSGPFPNTILITSRDLGGTWTTASLANQQIPIFNGTLLKDFHGVYHSVYILSQDVLHYKLEGGNTFTEDFGEAPFYTSGNGGALIALKKLIPTFQANLDPDSTLTIDVTVESPSTANLLAEGDAAPSLILIQSFGASLTPEANTTTVIDLIPGTDDGPTGNAVFVIEVDFWTE